MKFTAKREYSEAQARAEKKYRQAHASIRITLEKEDKERFMQYANTLNLSLTEMIKRAVEESITNYNKTGENNG